MKSFLNSSDEIPIQSTTGYIPAPEHIKATLSKRYKRDIFLIIAWMIGLTIFLSYYEFLLIVNQQEKTMSAGLILFHLVFLGICFWRIIERKRNIRRIGEAEAKEVTIHHLTKGLHLFSAEAKVTEDGEKAVSYVFYLSRKNLRNYKKDKKAKWLLIKVNKDGFRYELVSN